MHYCVEAQVGSLREEFRPRDLVIPDQIIDKTTRRAGSFFETGAVHVEFAEPFCPILRRILLEAGADGENKDEALRPRGPQLQAADEHRIHDQAGVMSAWKAPAFSTRERKVSCTGLWGRRSSSA